MDQGYAAVNASASFGSMAGCANPSITEPIRLTVPRSRKGSRTPEAAPLDTVSVAGSIPAALT